MPSPLTPGTCLTVAHDIDTHDSSGSIASAHSEAADSDGDTSLDDEDCNPRDSSSEDDGDEDDGDESGTTTLASGTDDEELEGDEDDEQMEEDSFRRRRRIAVPGQQVSLSGRLHRRAATDLVAWFDAGLIMLEERGQTSVAGVCPLPPAYFGCSREKTLVESVSTGVRIWPVRCSLCCREVLGKRPWTLYHYTDRCGFEAFCTLFRAAPENLSELLLQILLGEAPRKDSQFTFLDPGVFDNKESLLDHLSGEGRGQSSEAADFCVAFLVPSLACVMLSESKVRVSSGALAALSVQAEATGLGDVPDHVRYQSDKSEAACFRKCFQRCHKYLLKSCAVCSDFLFDFALKCLLALLNEILGVDPQHEAAKSVNPDSHVFTGIDQGREDTNSDANRHIRCSRRRSLAQDGRTRHQLRYNFEKEHTSQVEARRAADKHWDELVSGEIRPRKEELKPPILHVVADACAEILSPRRASASVAIQPISPRRRNIVPDPRGLLSGFAEDGSEAPQVALGHRRPATPMAVDPPSPLGRRGSGPPWLTGSLQTSHLSSSGSPRSVRAESPRTAVQGASPQSPRSASCAPPARLGSPRGLPSSPRVPMDSPRALPSTPRAAATSLRARAHSPRLELVSPRCGSPALESRRQLGGSPRGTMMVDANPRSQLGNSALVRPTGRQLGIGSWVLPEEHGSNLIRAVETRSPRSGSGHAGGISALPASPRMKVMAMQASGSPRSPRSPRAVASPRSSGTAVSPRTVVARV